MISFTVSIIALIIGYLLYGRFVERVFKPDNRPMQQSIIVVRQLLQYVQGLVSAFQQQGQAQQGQSQQQGVVTQ